MRGVDEWLTARVSSKLFPPAVDALISGSVDASVERSGRPPVTRRAAPSPR